MKNILLWVVVSACATGGLFASAENAKRLAVKPADCVIVVPGNANAVVAFAAEELRTHLTLIGGRDVPVRTQASAGEFALHVGVRPAGDDRPLAPEEARWVIAPEGVWLFGDDAVNVDRGDARETATAKENRTGTLYAVYELLEQKLGVRWLEPGAAGVAFTPEDRFALPVERGAWVPALRQRHMRPAYTDNLRKMALSRGSVPAAFIFDTDEYVRRRADEAVWQRRMRMGRSVQFFYGHAFTEWWLEYGAEHPEFFALNRAGKRAPAAEIMQGAPDRIKMCVSNPALAREVARRHFTAGRGHVVNACENDSRGFCRCPQCAAWDVRLPGEENLDVDSTELPLTDRYLRFANAVQAEALKYDPAAKTTYYAYSAYRSPPRREKVADGVVIFFITSHFSSEEELRGFYAAWKAAGAKEVYLRPNDQCDDTGLPLGFEQNMFEKMQLANSAFHLTGTDYDTCWGYWPVSGMTNYIMARAFYRPERTFAEWEEEYCAGFGAASGAIRDYHRYWRQIWNERIQPNRERIVAMSGKLREVNDKLMQLTSLLYTEGDFDATDALLGAALRPDLSPATRARVENLQLANQHSRLKFHAMRCNELLSAASDAEKTAATNALLEFRREHQHDLNINWESMFYMENIYEDICGVQRLAGTQGKRWAEWGEMLKASIKPLRSSDEAPLR
ncbi:DUF4838 domain-containing protein [Horticoccus luteus]|uniref:DUF4838 domain-containing protein n=1 Tax=Horticoccus luteus TaxID=2862869 RepID=A0A8F9TSK8_9BACT|nr:DUF4838 domain-containing protein [Horticoccus luteus]QYM78464.1 DUF4838 domain-containing protein [Horticoccus luteus]